MAVLSRPSLRSSSRRHTGLEEVPPPGIQQNPLPTTRRGKRIRDHSSGSESNTSVKKQKPTPPQIPRRSKDHSVNRALKSLPLRDKPSTQDAVTSLTQIPPQQQINGFTTNNTYAATAHNAQATLQNHKLSINTTDGTNQVDKRSLRSHDGGSRCKSELALYFPNYDELVSIEPKKPEFLIPETILYITEDPSNSNLAISSPSSIHNHATSKARRPTGSRNSVINGSSRTLELSESTFTDLNDATRLDLSSFDKSSKYQKDTMTDVFYLKAHRRAERQEKQLRNIEKERAMHEKVQLERLMEGLRGHDWLRVMGISGITDGEKKAYEPKREYFIREVRVLLKKFQEWKEEEKRRKVEKEESMQDEDEEQDDEDEESNGESVDTRPDSPDVDASAERQLHQEAVSASKSSSNGQTRSHHKQQPHASAAPKPFTSFFSKPYMREAAIGGHRRGRARYAFGQPLPEPPDRPFELGSDILTPDVLAAQERKRRASKRHMS